MGFNLVLFLFFVLNIFATSIFEPEPTSEFDWLFDNYPVATCILAAGISLLFLLWAAKLCNIVWNHLVSDLFNIRKINYQEALTVSLILSIIFKN
jgi:hypothetical protein